ncbi:MAG: hypothetical protein ACLSS9_10735 [Acutalibacteraceae bacterium]
MARLGIFSENAYLFRIRGIGHGLLECRSACTAFWGFCLPESDGFSMAKRHAQWEADTAALTAPVRQAEAGWLYPDFFDVSFDVRLYYRKKEHCASACPS